MKDVLDDVRAWRARGDRVAIATVDAVKRLGAATPRSQDGDERERRGVGRRLGWLRRGRRRGAAAEVLRERDPRLLHFGIADSEAWTWGPCGGEIDVFVEEYLD